MKNLDKWDCEMILCLKQSKYVVNDIKTIWARRCGLEIGYVKLENVNSHLLDIVFELKDVIFRNSYDFTEFVMNLNPDKDNWLDSIIPNRIKETDFNIILFKRIDSLLSLTDTKDLPGFDEWYKEHGINIYK